MHLKKEHIAPLPGGILSAFHLITACYLGPTLRLTPPSPPPSPKTFVMASPMTSIIMVTDLSHSEVDEKAEGYGILGNIARDVPAEELLSLLGAFEKIQQSF